jgi:hypothetical protein
MKKEVSQQKSTTSISNSVINYGNQKDVRIDLSTNNKPTPKYHKKNGAVGNFVK